MSWTPYALPPLLASALLVGLAVLLIGLIAFMFALPNTVRSDSPVLIVLSFAGLLLICFASASFILFPIPGLALVLVTKWTQPKVAASDTEEVQELRDAISQLAGEVGELHERIDFAERLITANRDT